MQALTFFFAFVAVLALIGAAAWLVRRFAGNRLGANANRGRMPRLAVIDAAAVDGRRRLVLVRRDNIEHLLMIGGPTDIVVESNIVRASRDQIPQRQSVGTELPRIPPLADSTWAEPEGNLDQPEPHQPEPPPRTVRPAFADEARRPMPTLSERRAEPMGRAESIAGFMPEPLPRAEPRVEAPSPRIARSELPSMPRAPLRPVETPARASAMRAQERAVPPPVPPAPPPPPNMASADQNLADMAQRLEAALRRPAGEARLDAAEPRVGAAPAAPEPPPGRAPRSSGEVSNGGAARNEGPAGPPTPKAAPPSPSPAPSSSPKTGFENLEDEMASLLGRPKTPS